MDSSLIDFQNFDQYTVYTDFFFLTEEKKKKKKEAQAIFFLQSSEFLDKEITDQLKTQMSMHQITRNNQHDLYVHRDSTCHIMKNY